MKRLETLTEKLKLHGQEHLLDFEGLSPEEYETYLTQLEGIDFDIVETWKRPAAEPRGEISPIRCMTAEEIEKKREIFEAEGIRALRAGKVAAVLLAGGQGTRLGADGPKGAYNIGVTRPLYIFEQLIVNLKEVCAKFGGVVPLFIMTSEKNDGETRAFLKEHAYFGYPEEGIRFFAQEMLPSVDFEGKILREAKGRLALSPGGNGGWYASLLRANVLADFPAVEWFNVFAVDNVLQRIADPAFVGATILSNAGCGAKVVSKANPEERVGVLCLEDGLPAVIEYYELTPGLANARNEDGRLLYGSGVILNYLFSAKRLEEIASARIPVHVVKKKVPYLDGAGNFIQPQSENGYKFETLILDMVRLAGSCLPFEVVREREFAPIKNKTGVDSVDTARVLLQKNGVEL